MKGLVIAIILVLVFSNCSGTSDQPESQENNDSTLAQANSEEMTGGHTIAECTFL